MTDAPQNPGTPKPSALRRAWTHYRSGGKLGPWKLGEWALLFVVLFTIVHLAGFRQHTSILSGTMPAEDRQFTLVAGTAYVLLYFLAIYGAPILLIGSAIYAVLLKAFRVENAAPGEQP